MARLTKERLFEDLDPIVLELEGFLSTLGKGVGEVYDIKFSLKNDVTDADGAAVFDKTLIGGGITLDTPSEEASIEFVQSDYSTMPVGGRYKVCFGVKFDILDPLFSEYIIQIDGRDWDEIEIIQDRLRS